MNGLNYLLQTNLYLMLFMGFYILVLRNETFFRQNRFYLNTSIFLSFVIPFINSDWFRDLFITQKVREAAIMPSQMIYDAIVVGVNEGAATFTVSEAIFIIYASGATFLLLRFLVRLVFLSSSLKTQKGAAFSFFNTLVVDEELPKSETIIDHEKVHMRQWHSADIIFVELAAIINWFNPVMYLYKKEVRHIHEFIADEEAAELMQSKSDYALLLFSNTLGVDPQELRNNFFNKSLLKRRIVMLHKNKSRRTGLWKYGFSAPLFALMLIVSAATASSESNVLSVDNERSISVIEKIGTLSIPEVIKETTNIEVMDKATAIETRNGQAANQGDLKSYIAENIKYTEGARNAKAFGYIQVNFLVKNQKISGAEITKNLHPELDKEVLNAVNSFDSEIAIPDNDYSIVVVFLDMSDAVGGHKVESIPKNTTFSKTNLGFILARVGADGKLKAEGLSTMTRSNQTTGMLEPIGFVSPMQDKAPEFPGGAEAWQKYLIKTMRYPAEARNNNVQGRVLVSFVVEKDGSISEIKILRGIGSGADEEAVRVLAISPKWNPGTKNGEPARVAFTIPINFGLTPGTNSAVITAQPATTNSAGLQEIVVNGSDNSIKDFASVEFLPEFAGGLEGWGKYLQANLKYPEMARKDKVTGRVIMSFIIEKNGSISDIKVMRGLGSGLDEEAVRVLKNSPSWKPGILAGRPVRVAYTMPIFFQLAEEKGTRP